MGRQAKRAGWARSYGVGLHSAPNEASSTEGPANLKLERLALPSLGPHERLSTQCRTNAAVAGSRSKIALLGSQGVLHSPPNEALDYFFGWSAPAGHAVSW